MNELWNLDLGSRAHSSVKRSAPVHLNLEMIYIFPDNYKLSAYEDEEDDDNEKYVKSKPTISGYF